MNSAIDRASSRADGGVRVASGGRRAMRRALLVVAALAVSAGSLCMTPEAGAQIDTSTTGAIPGPPPVRSFPEAGPVAPPPTAIVSPVTPNAHCGTWYLQSSYAGRPTGATWWEYSCVRSECEGYCNADVTYATWTDYYHWDGSQPVFHAEYTTPHLSESFPDGCWYWWDPTGAGAWYELTCTQTPAPTGPDAPTIGHATANDYQSATIEWLAPASDGGSPITGYVVTAYVGYAPVKVRIFNTPSTTETVTGLSDGTTYRFRVRAYNAIGVSGFSKVTNQVTPLGG